MTPPRHVRANIGLTLADTLIALVWFEATGGVRSPWSVALYVWAISLALRFGLRVTIWGGVAYGLFYLAIVEHQRVPAGQTATIVEQMSHIVGVSILAKGPPGLAVFGLVSDPRFLCSPFPLPCNLSLMALSKDDYRVKYRPRRYDELWQGPDDPTIARLREEEIKVKYPPGMIYYGDFGCGK
jgi:hypothetical protein